MTQNRLGKLSPLFIFVSALLTLLAGTQQLYAADVYIPKSRIELDNKPRYFVISIGINNYIDTYWGTLKWPASDATRVADNIGTHTRSQKSTRLLINESATRENVTNALQDISRQAGPEDTVILYISGHGTLALSENGELERIFLLHDSRQQDLFSSALPFSTLQAWLNGLRSRKNLMILATCHSGEGKSRLPSSVKLLLGNKKGKLISLSDVSEGALILTAAANGEAALENDKLQGDIYTYYLLEALSVYDRNKDGVISALEAHDYARDRTWVFSNGRQRPTANAKLIGDADIPLYGAKTKKGLPVLEAYSEDLSGFFIKVDDNVKGRLPSAFPLNPNGSQVALYSPNDNEPIARYQVHASQGQRLTLPRIMNYRPIHIGSSINFVSWVDNDWNKLTGTTSGLTAEMIATYQFGSYGFGVLYNPPLKDSNMTRRNIESTSEMRSIMFVGEYRRRINNWSVTTRLEYGREKMQVKLLDTIINDILYYQDTASAYGLSVSLNKILRYDLSVGASIGIRDADWNFGLIGDLDGQRHWLSIGINYRFGWLARSL